MEIYLDTADVQAVKRLARILPLAGVTTNPSIVARSGQTLSQLLPALHQALGHKGRLFAQVMATHCDDMIEEALWLGTRFEGLTVKIPATQEGLAAIKALKQQGVNTLATAIYATGQGMLAALAGASYLAPYVNRLDAQGGNGCAMVAELQCLLACQPPDTRVLAASFRTPKQIVDCLLTGCADITLPIDLADALLSLPAVDAAIEQFQHDWSTAFGSLALRPEQE